MPFRVSRSGGNGLSYGATRSAGLFAPTRGVRAAVGEWTWLDQVAALALVIPADAAFSHLTAAQLLDLPLPARNPFPFHVTVPTGGRRGRRRQIAWHEAAIAGRTTTARGIPTTTAGRTWLDCGSHLSLQDLVAMADRILRRRLERTLEVPAGIRGARTLRKALTLADAGSRSPKESILRVNLHLAGLPRPEVNFDVIHLGEWVGCGDLVWPEYRLYLEYDGKHHKTAKQRHQDAQTRNRLAQLGWKVRVVTSAMTVWSVVDMVTEDLTAGGLPRL